jgi:hypothetical protein
MTSDDPHPKTSTRRPSLGDEAQLPNFFTPSQLSVETLMRRIGAGSPEKI